MQPLQVYDDLADLRVLGAATTAALARGVVVVVLALQAALVFTVYFACAFAEGYAQASSATATTTRASRSQGG